MDIPWQNDLYVVGEIGLNHNGQLDLALEAISIAKRAGCDAIKFQTFSADEFCDPSVEYEYMSQGIAVREPMIDMFRRSELPANVWQECVNFARSIGIDMFTTPQNSDDLRHFVVSELPAIKVGSDDLTNTALLREIAEHSRPMILSSGMASLAQVATALEAVDWANRKDVALLVCTSEYPAAPASLNLKRIKSLQEAFPGLAVGFSDHSRGSTAVACAVALGARVFEKHFTVNKALPGPDHWFSADADELTDWCDAIREAHASLGSGVVQPTQAETELAVVARRSVVALTDISPGTVISKEMLGMRRPGTGLTSDSVAELIGCLATRQIHAYEPLRWDMVTTRAATTSND